MRELMAAAVGLAFATSAAATPALSPEQTARLFLDAYARGDQQAIESMSDPDLAIYGSDVAEVGELAPLLAWHRITICVCGFPKRYGCDLEKNEESIPC